MTPKDFPVGTILRFKNTSLHLVIEGGCVLLYTLSQDEPICVVKKHERTAWVERDWEALGTIDTIAEKVLSQFKE